jgi:integrative and conjugative element protein (TIGR02256 family)
MNGVADVWISAKLLSSLAEEAEKHAPNETGGVLMGYWADPSSLVIRVCLGPGPAAIHEKYRFVPDHEYHVTEVENIFRQSNGSCTYLGDWHSHPEGAPLLSQKDRRTLKFIATDAKARAPAPIMLLVAGGPVWNPVVWCARRKKMFCLFDGYDYQKLHIRRFDD